jgi:uncharacterized protein
LVEIKLKFIVDYNSGKLVTWLRMMGYDSALFTGGDDSRMVKIALNEGRTILTRDNQVMNFGVVANGKVKAVYIMSEDPEAQIKQVVESLHLDTRSGLFSLCLECNRPVNERTKEQVRGRVPPHAFETQEQYFECPSCKRIYWKGTHWENMLQKLEKIEKQ